MSPKIRIDSLEKKKDKGEKIVMVTAYDYPTGRLADEAGVDVVLVGDSLGEVVLGYETTIPVTLDQMIHHTTAVHRAVKHALLIADMPFMTYKISPEEALRNGGRLVQEGGAEGVKVEGGQEIAPMVKRMVEAGIPVMGHLGFTMQSIHALSGPRLQGKTEEQAKRLTDDAYALQDAGCFSIVLEVIPADLGEQISSLLTIPTIGIGAGVQCDGQVLVLADIIGLSFGRPLRHAKQYANCGDMIRQALQSYANEVRGGTFPTAEQTFSVD